MIKRTFFEWLHLLKKDRVRDKDGSNWFQWKLEESFDERYEQALHYFSERPDLLAQECCEHLIELDEMECSFLSTEDYEKCVAVRDVRKALKEKYGSILEPAKLTP